ncbi:hypothetical protein [Mycolicibacterium fortuitum]|uniref:hypothetical protein n=1 Tax=Mycolicibacterium fortuitum TaxID=1766 RepID=UPI000B0DE872|nr:hypothetical protein [Mycolicibacterium fortuitum]
MLRAIVCTSVLLAAGVSTTACGPQAEAPAQTDQSKTFFPGTVQTYGLDLTPTDRDHLTELYALRQMDPCGFFDRKTLEDNGHKDFSYTYTAAHAIAVEGVSPRFPIGGDGCTIAFPSMKVGLELSVAAGERRANDRQFDPDPAHPGVMKRTSMCTFRAPIPLSVLDGAPASMRDPMLEVTPINIADGRVNFDDTVMCELGGVIAGGVAAQIDANGVPVHSDKSSTAARFLTADPCAAAADVHAVGFEWWQPSPEAQWPTTWRHPSVCEFLGEKSADRPATRTAIVKYGFTVWSDDVVESPSGNLPVRSEKDDVELLDFSSADSPSCTVVAKTDLSIEPATVGTGAPDLAPPTPVVSVWLHTPAGENCADRAKTVALAAVQRAH